VVQTECVSLFSSRFAFSDIISICQKTVAKNSRNVKAEPTDLQAAVTIQ
jgi:hypothetical protein